jgi:hypothetical protein
MKVTRNFKYCFYTTMVSVSNFFLLVWKSVLNVDCPENLGFKKWSLILKISRSKTTDTATFPIRQVIYQLKTRGL